MGATAVTPELDRTNKILYGPLGKNIFFFALPLAATGMLQQLFNAADVAVVGRFVGTDAMAAVGGNSPIVAMLVNLFISISMGAGVVISNLIGRGDYKTVTRAVDASLLLALICGALATVVGELFAEPILRVMSVPAEVFDMAEVYLRIYLAGMPAILLYNFEAAIFRSQGDSKTPLVCLTISGVLNVVLNVIFVVEFKMTTDGVALATVISGAVCAVLLTWRLTRCKGPVVLKRHRVVIDGAIMLRILKIGIPTGIQSMMFSISNVCIQSAINSLGSAVMAGSAAAGNIEVMVYFIVNSFGQACTTFTSQNHGAGNMPRCRAALKQCLIQNFVLITAVSAVIIIFARPILSLFNSEPAVIEAGCTRLIYILCAESLNAAIDILSGAMRGYGRSISPAITSLVGICGVRLLWVYTVFTVSPTYATLMLCYPLSWTVTTASLIIAYVSMMRRMRRNTCETGGTAVG